MITIKIKHLSDDETKKLIHSYMNQYNHCYRVAYNLKFKKDKVNYKDVSSLNNIELLDSWFINSALMESNWNTDDKPIIFGGRKNFIKRCKNQISKEEFNKKRLNPICSVGEKITGTKCVRCNRKFKIADDLSSIIFKPTRKTPIPLLLPNLKPSTRKILTQLYEHQVVGDIPITYKLDTEYVYISFDESILSENKESKKIENRVFTIDLNPNYVGWSIVDWKSESDFTVVKSGVYSMKTINDIDFSLKNKHISSEAPERQHIRNKREYEIYEISKSLINTALYYKCSLFVIEDLTIKHKDNKRGTKYNKLVNNCWMRDKLTNNIMKRCNIFNIKLLKVIPNYSSFVGNILFRSLNLPDMCLASIEIGRRGYEFNQQYINKIKEIKKNIVFPDINEFNAFYNQSLEELGVRSFVGGWTELYDFIKKSKMMYRLSLDKFNLEFSRKSTPKSLVFCYNFIQ